MRKIFIVLIALILSACSTQPLSAPINIFYTQEGSTINLSWEAVPGADAYGTYVSFERLPFIPPIPMWEVDEPEIKLVMGDGSYTLYI